MKNNKSKKPVPINAVKNDDTWSVRIVNIDTGDSITFDDINGDTMLRSGPEGTGDYIEYRILHKADGSVIEYPMSSFISFFSPEREKINAKRESEFKALKQRKFKNDGRLL